MALLDSSATSHFNKPPDEYPLLVIVQESCSCSWTSHEHLCHCVATYAQTSYQPCKATCYSVLEPSLKMAVTIFQASKDCAPVHDSNNITIMTTKLVILQGSQDANKISHVNPSCHFCHYAPPCIYNVNDFSSTKHIICYCHTT